MNLIFQATLGVKDYYYFIDEGTDDLLMVQVTCLISSRWRVWVNIYPQVVNYDDIQWYVQNTPKWPTIGRVKRMMTNLPAGKSCSHQNDADKFLIGWEMFPVKCTLKQSEV